MSLTTRLFARLAGLPPAETHRLNAERGLRIPLPDGVELLADRIYPPTADAAKAPILLARTPYGREGVVAAPYLVMAERGYQVVVVSSRGTFGSGGEWEPFRHEQADGRAVLAWLAAQPWFSGRVGT